MQGGATRMQPCDARTPARSSYERVLTLQPPLLVLSLCMAPGEGQLVTPLIQECRNDAPSRPALQRCQQGSHTRYSIYVFKELTSCSSVTHDLLQSRTGHDSSVSAQIWTCPESRPRNPVPNMYPKHTGGTGDIAENALHCNFL